jgi:prepilin peptidase CpaA
LLASAIVITAACVASYTDFKDRKIPNALVAALLLTGLLLHAHGGWAPLATSLLLALVTLLLGTIAFAFKVMGGGDVKFLAAAAATLGWPHTASFLLFTLAAGGVLAIVVSAARGRLPLLVRNVTTLTCAAAAGLPAATPVTPAGTVPYAFAILAGAVSCSITTLHF